MKMDLDELLPLTHQIRRVYSRRAAKRESIFKRLTYISQLIASNGSRTKITTLITYVERTFNETLTSHEQLMALISEESDDYNDMWIENLRIDIDVYLSEVQEYFEIRLMDLASESGCNDKPDCDDVHHESINSDSLDKDIITTHDNKGIDNSQLLNCSNGVAIQKENICSGMKHREASLSHKPDETPISSIIIRKLKLTTNQMHPLIASNNNNRNIQTVIKLNQVVLVSKLHLTLGQLTHG